MRLALATLALGAGPTAYSSIRRVVEHPRADRCAAEPLPLGGALARPATLAWPKREAAIVAMLGRLDADVVCLQEVEVALWDGPLRRTHQPGVERRPSCTGDAAEHLEHLECSRRSTRSFSHRQSRAG